MLEQRVDAMMVVVAVAVAVVVAAVQTAMMTMDVDVANAADVGLANLVERGWCTLTSGAVSWGPPSQWTAPSGCPANPSPGHWQLHYLQGIRKSWSFAGSLIASLTALELLQRCHLRG